eukprot:365201-Chlamydomonas_euryale.AAC.4
MHARKCPRPEAKAHLCACMSETEGCQGRGRRDRPRLEAELSMFCARMPLPRFHKRVNARTGPSCIQHRRDLRSNKCMHERTHAHASTCMLMLHYPGI